MQMRRVAMSSLVPVVCYLTGCYKKVPVSPADLKQPSQERIVEITTTDGQEISFDGAGASIVNGAIRGFRRQATPTPYEIPESQIKHREKTRQGQDVWILSVTTVDGREIRFEPPGAIVHDGVISGRALTQTVYEIPLDKVQRLWVQRTDPLKVLGLVVGIAAAGFGVLIAIVALTKQSCPFVYSWDGEKYVFDAEPYGGAITRGLERDDYSELKHLREQDGLYRLLLTNEVDETQFTNLMELWVVDHARGSHVVSDEDGRLRAFTQIQQLSDARDREGNDLLPWLQSTDRKIWEPDAVAGPNGDLRQEVILTFPKPQSVTRVNLLANAATGLWGSYMIKQMVELHGRDTATWLAALDEDPAGRQAIHAWGEREGTYRLPIEVEEETGWTVRGALPSGGPLLAEDRAIPLDVSRARGNQLRIRLRPPVGFWAFNSFFVAYGDGQAVTVSRVAASSAKTSEGQNILPDLAATDDRYYSMPDTTARAQLTFPVPARKPGAERTVFLHSRGWYQLHLRNNSAPDLRTFNKILTVPGAAAEFAAERFAEWRQDAGR
jgi:hypothetical protein